MSSLLPHEVNPSGPGAAGWAGSPVTGNALIPARGPSSPDGYTVTFSPEIWLALASAGSRNPKSPPLKSEKRIAKSTDIHSDPASWPDSDPGGGGGAADVASHPFDPF